MIKLPELRFAGFDGEWEEKEFGKVIERKSKSSVNNSLPRVEYEDIIPEIGKLNKDINSKSSKKKGIYFEIDEVLFGKLRPYLKNYLNPQFEGIAVGDFWILNNKTGNNSFLFYYIQISRFQYIANTSIGTKMPRSDWNLVSGSKFIYPSKNEQEKIGDLFRKLDDLIEIQECKVSKMEDFKKSMLQKMFPKKDELVPEFRFDGFDGDWLVSRLGEVTSLRGGYAFKSQNYIENGIPILRISNINSNGTTNEDYVYYTEIINDDNISLYNGSIVLAMSGATTGKISILKTQCKVYQNQRVGYFTKNDIVDYLYLSVILRSHLFTSQIDKILIAGAQPNISSKDVENFSFKFPSLEEQEKIGNFFKNLDTQIENEEKLLESYKMMKKSLLQKMFV